MPTVELGEWLPDLPSLNNPGLTTASGVLPNAKGYVPFNPKTTFQTTAMNTMCLGAPLSVAYSATDPDAQKVYEYGGSATKLYQLGNTAQNFTDTTRASGGDYSAVYWKFVRWGNKVIGVNGADLMQEIDIGGAAFSDLGPTEENGLQFTAHHVAVVRDFLVVANVELLTDAIYPNRVYWSGVNDEMVFGTNAAKQSDWNQIISSGLDGGGTITDMVGGSKYGIIFQRDAVHKMTYVGPQVIFRFDELTNNLGTPYKQSAVRFGDRVWFISDDSVYEITNGQQIRNIGKNKVNRYLASNKDPAVTRVIGAYDHKNDVVAWSWPSNPDPGYNDNVLFYDWRNERFTNTTIDTEAIYSSFNHDDGGVYYAMNSVGTDHKRQHHGTAGTTTVTLITGEHQLFPERRAFVSAVRPLIERQVGGAVSWTAQARTRNSLHDDNPSTTSAISPDVNEWAHFRSDARYHSFIINLTTSAFDVASAVDVKAVPSGGQ